MTAYDTANLNTDATGKKTSARWNEAETRWESDVVIVDGGSSSTAVATGVGAPADAAVTDPASSGSIIALLKGLLTFLRISPAGVGKAEDAAHVSGDTGIMALAVRKDTSTTGLGADGDYTPLGVDSSGRLWTRVENTVTTAPAAPSNASTTALASNLVVKASAGTLFGLQGYNNLGTDQFIQLHNAAALPSDGAIPVVSFVVAANSNFSLDFGDRGRAFSTGIVICNSSAVATKVIGAADLWLDAQYS